MNDSPVRLDDKFSLSKDRIILNGSQALVRLCLLQAERDRQAGLKTGGYVSGYRGSPLGGVDQQFHRAGEELAAAGVVFEPGLNEDLAATAIWGTQQAELHGEGTHDGVFGMWYGKGPGVDRSGDVLRHGNLAGSSRNGGVIVLMGDDHTCESSTTAHQSEFALVDAMIPILNPADISDLLSFGLHGWALSRYAGTWCGLKCVKEIIESTTVVDAAPSRFQVCPPNEDTRPADGLNIRLNDTPHAQEARLHRHKIAAARAYVRANILDRIVTRPKGKSAIGIVSTGKSWTDVIQAIDELGLDTQTALEAGIGLYKVAMPWPLEPGTLTEFAAGLDLLIVVEEKRSLIEQQARSILYGRAGAPPIIGKEDENGNVLFPSESALNPLHIAAVIGARAAELRGNRILEDRSNELAAILSREHSSQLVERKPYFCAGCPHNSSTHVPEDSRAYAGIGCHWMVQFMDRRTLGYTHMGGEGANWIGEARFSKRGHVFQNMGDGTYNHSGLLAIRAALASGTNMTFKILYNDAVAMTGGQSHEGNLSPLQIARDVTALGVSRVDLVTDSPKSYRGRELPGDTRVHHRDHLMDVQTALSETEGVTVLIYEQTCAAEKRRRRKRGTLPEPPRRVFIHEGVCEGCGDCGIQSNCVAILPVETEFGRKRQIDQYSCNKDFSCVRGFCPSFVTVEDPVLHDGHQPTRAVGIAIPEPELETLERSWSIAVAGVGGTGVVTVAALLGMAAHVEGLGCGIVDMAGLAQKGGAVVSHVRIAKSPSDIGAIRIASQGADLVIGCDLVVSGSRDILSLVRPGLTGVVVNSNELMTDDFVRDSDFRLPADEISHSIAELAGDDMTTFVNATRIASERIGDTIAANLFMLGVAFQKGMVPVSAKSLRESIRINGTAVESNLQAFETGRHWAYSPEELSKAHSPACTSQGTEILSDDGSIEALVERRSEQLAEYQNQAYADRYRRLVNTAAGIDRNRASGAPDGQVHGSDASRLTRAVAHSYFKLMAYKDEYEVARLYSDPSFETSLERTFKSHGRLKLHLAPPLLARREPSSGRMKKREFGPWIFSVLRFLSKLRKLRGTPFDPFGYTQERQMERQLISDYEKLVQHMADIGPALDYDVAVDLARLPEIIRGFGPVKAENVEKARKKRKELLGNLRKAPVTRVVAD